MKITFRTNSGFKLASVDLLVFLSSTLTFFSCLVFLLSDAKNLVLFAESIVPFLNHKEGLFKIMPDFFITLSKFVAGIIAILTFSVSIGRVMIGLFRYIAFKFNRNAFVLFRTVNRKISSEIATFPNISDSSYVREMNKAKEAYEMLREATDRGDIQNNNLWEPEWPNMLTHHSLLEFVTHPDNVETSRIQLFKQELDTLKGLLESCNKEKDSLTIEFIFSPVQPSILKVIENIKDVLSKTHKIKISYKTTTGPLAIKYAYTRKQSYIRNNIDALVAFVAPISAFCTYEKTLIHNESEKAKTKIASINELFIPVFCLMHECQNILIVESETSISTTPRHLYYYNNSTAEEFIANHTFRELECFQAKVPIDNIDEYQLLLKNRHPEIKLNAGDAIVTWPPLTDYYEHKVISRKNEQLKIFIKERNMEFNSQIYLFADKNGFELNDNKSKILWSLLRCIAKQYLVLQQNNEGKLPNISSLLQNYKILKERRQFFEMLIGK